MPSHLARLFRSSVRLAATVVASAAALAAAAPAAAQCSNGVGSCLLPHPNPGCDDPACCENVCATDPSCCSSNWDAACAQTAEVSCVGLCGAAVSLSCLVQHETPACDDETCCTSVCAIDSFCCDVRWDFACVLIAQLNCNIGEPGVCGGPNTESCYEPHASAACDDAVCCATVCAVSPSCCEVTWDVLCASIAVKACIGFCQPECPPGAIQEAEICGQNLNDPCYFPSANPTLQTIPCEGVACGRITVTQGPNGLVRDVDVWRFIATDANGDGLTSVQLSLASGFVGFAALVPATGCPPLSTAATFVNSSLCIESPSEPVCVPPGEYRIVVAQGIWPNFGNDAVECDVGDGYYLRVFCSEQLCLPPCSPDAGSCYEPRKTPGCGDVECCELICATDPFCCEINWDGGCVQAAIDTCAGIPANDECAGATPLAPGPLPFNTFGATDGALAPNTNCIEGGGSPSTRDLWFSYTPAIDGLVTIATCGAPISFDSAIEVYGGSCGALTLIACDGNAGSACLPVGSASVTWNPDCGQTYLIRVGGGSGAGTLTLTQLNGPACPQCPADLDGDSVIGPSDLAILLGSWGGSGASDLDGNGTVSSPDLAILLGAWGPC